MAIKNLARAITQGGHDINLNDRVRLAHRRERREARRFIVALLADEQSDAQIDIGHAHYGYAEKISTGKDTPLVRWLNRMVGHNFEEAYHRLCLADRRSARGRELIERTLSIVERADDDATWVSDHDMVVDLDGTLCRGSDFVSEYNLSPRPIVRWSVHHKVVDHCGDLFWKKRNGELIPLTEQEARNFHLLPGNRQRDLKGYYRSMFGKRRLNRELPWQKRWHERQLALGRDV